MVTGFPGHNRGRNQGKIKYQGRFFFPHELPTDHPKYKPLPEFKEAGKRYCKCGKEAIWYFSDGSVACNGCFNLHTEGEKNGPS